MFELDPGTKLDSIFTSLDASRYLRSVRDFARKEWPFGQSG